ncbi:hypothetical protein Bequi_12400 [Brachybacterium sp. JHP9]|uniref:Lipoprotein n=1 Tax=Brachybacterium equifaecis TaxID=2910770 RepID=A0ABT0R2K8_9MICO|nr:hypothetical protein [Brachybacterium equifaecis]MCL6424168.1 hypothetical protein [Brachybacterium equifaecis]
MRKLLSATAMLFSVLMLAACTSLGASLHPVTEIQTVWEIDDIPPWQVEEDLCADGASASPYELPDGPDHFICEFPDEGVRACALDGVGDSVTCIVGGVGHKMIRFDSPTAAAGLELEEYDGEPQPLSVRLEDGKYCWPMLPGAREFWVNEDYSAPPGMTVWYECTKGYNLISPSGPAETFTRGERWTVQLWPQDTEGMDYPIQPETVGVKSARFADHEHPTLP